MVTAVKTLVPPCRKEKWQKLMEKRQPWDQNFKPSLGNVALSKTLPQNKKEKGRGREGERKGLKEEPTG